MAREPITDDGEHAVQPGMKVLSFLVAPDLKDRVTDAAWSTKKSRGALMRAFLAEANFEGWLKTKTLKVAPIKVGAE